MKRSKKLLAIVPVAALIFAACGDDDDNESSDTTAATEDTAAGGDDDGGGDGDGDGGDEGGGDEGGGDGDGGGDDGDGGGDDGDGGGEEVDQTQAGDLTFHMITHSDDGPFWSVVKRGAEAAAAAVGVELVWLGSNNDPGVQVSDIETAIAEGSDGIAASLPSPDQLVGPLQAAVAAGIPVYTINSGVNDYQDIGATTHVGQTEFIAGQGAGLRFNEAGATKILCGIQEQDNVALGERCDGVADTFDGEVVAQFMGLDADQTAQEAAINAALSADPDIDAFQGVGPVITLSGLRAADALGRDLFIGGFDVTPDLLTNIKDGNILFTVDQQQYLQGYLPIILLYLEVTNANTAGGGLPILTGPGFIDQSNAEAVEALVEAGTR